MTSGVHSVLIMRSIFDEKSEKWRRKRLRDWTSYYEIYMKVWLRASWSIRRTCMKWSFILILNSEKSKVVHIFLSPIPFERLLNCTDIDPSETRILRSELFQSPDYHLNKDIVVWRHDVLNWLQTDIHFQSGKKKKTLQYITDHQYNHNITTYS